MSIPQTNRPGRSGARLAFSHVGIYVHDMAAMERFYTGALEFDVTDRGFLGQTELIFMSRDTSEHHQIVLASGRPETISFNLINQISLRTDDVASLRTYYHLALEHGASDMQPASHGNALSIYFRDPENNRIEIFMDTPWYVTQPMRIPFDFSLDDEALITHIEAQAQALPGYVSHAQWVSRMETLMEKK